jgi:hypothetical protein
VLNLRKKLWLVALQAPSRPPFNFRVSPLGKYAILTNMFYRTRILAYLFSTCQDKHVIQ